MCVLQELSRGQGVHEVSAFFILQVGSLDRVHQINTRVLDHLCLLLQRLVGRLKFLRLHPELELNLTNLQYLVENFSIEVTDLHSLELLNLSLLCGIAVVSVWGGERGLEVGLSMLLEAVMITVAPVVFEGAGVAVLESSVTPNAELLAKTCSHSCNRRLL